MAAACDGASTADGARQPRAIYHCKSAHGARYTVYPKNYRHQFGHLTNSRHYVLALGRFRTFFET